MAKSNLNQPATKGDIQILKKDDKDNKLAIQKVSADVDALYSQLNKRFDEQEKADRARDEKIDQILYILQKREENDTTSTAQRNTNTERIENLEEKVFGKIQL